MAHFASASNTNSILNRFDGSVFVSVLPVVFNAFSDTLTKRTDSFRIFIKLLSVLVGSFACGGGYGNWNFL